MKLLILIACVSILSLSEVCSQAIDCSRLTHLGEKELCLPRIVGYQECYTDPIVRQIADATEVSMNSVLGFYLNMETYSKKDSLGLIRFDDYFKVYSTNALNDYNADNVLLEEMINVLSGNFITKNWDELSKEIDEVGFDGEVGVPILIEEYRMDDNSFSMVMLVKYELEGADPFTLALTINGYLKNERLIWMAYYLNYKNQDVIRKLKEKSNIILQNLIYAGN